MRQIRVGIEKTDKASPLRETMASRRSWSCVILYIQYLGGNKNKPIRPHTNCRKVKEIGEQKREGDGRRSQKWALRK